MLVAFEFNVRYNFIFTRAFWSDRMKNVRILRKGAENVATWRRSQVPARDPNPPWEWSFSRRQGYLYETLESQIGVTQAMFSPNQDLTWPISQYLWDRFISTAPLKGTPSLQMNATFTNQELPIYGFSSTLWELISQKMVEIGLCARKRRFRRGRTDLINFRKRDNMASLNKLISFCQEFNIYLSPDTTSTLYETCLWTEESGNTLKRTFRRARSVIYKHR